MPQATRSGDHHTYRCYRRGPDGIRELSSCGPGALGKLPDPAEVVKEVNEVLATGAEIAMIEGQELMLNGAPNKELIKVLQDNVDVSRCMFELSTPRVGSTSPEIYAAKKFLVKTFGPDVNLGNVTADVVIETETTRLGLGSAGPLSLM